MLFKAQKLNQKSKLQCPLGNEQKKIESLRKKLQEKIKLSRSQSIVVLILFYSYQVLTITALIIILKSKSKIETK